MNKLKIAYFGTPYFSARFLEKLLTDKDLKNLIEIKLVVTQPDMPIGRKQVLTKTPVKIVAEKYGIEVYDKEIKKFKFQIKNLDLVFLFAYGSVILNDLLNLPKFGFLNTHPSLLPKYRGPSPMVYPLILGDKKTGVTLIRLNNQIDHGPIIAQEEMEIKSTDKRTDMEIKLTNLAFELFKKTIIKLIKNPTSLKLRGTRQNDSEATFTRLLTKKDGFRPFSTLKKAVNDEKLTVDETPHIIKEYRQNSNLTLKQYNIKMEYDYFRGMFPWPGIWTTVKIKNQPKRLKITDMEFKKGKLLLKKVQLEGKNEVDFKTFNTAYKIFAL